MSLPRFTWPFTVLVLLLAAANVFGIWLGLTHRTQLVAESPRLSTVWPLYLACPFITLGALAALWCGKRWGLWLGLVVAGLVLSIEVYASGLAPHVFRVPIAALLLVLAARSAWGRLS